MLAMVRERGDAECLCQVAARSVGSTDKLDADGVYGGVVEGEEGEDERHRMTGRLKYTATVGLGLSNDGEGMTAWHQAVAADIECHTALRPHAALPPAPHAHLPLLSRAGVLRTSSHSRLQPTIQPHGVPSLHQSHYFVDHG